ncbi:dihydrofolate reductase family protein [Jatrophihabitans sp. YIM 134969]
MARLRVHNFTISLDGFGAGSGQRLDAPMGDHVEGLHAWMFATAFGRAMFGGSGGTTGVDNEFAVAGDDGIGATIMGRHMFAPAAGPWPDPSWRGWWGETPPYGHDVFVMTHQPRPDLVMDGGTVFHFVTGSPEDVLAQAVEAADGGDVRLGGGASTVDQFLRAGLVDDLHLVISPILVGSGARLFTDLAGLPDGYRVSALTPSDTSGVVHATITRRDPA